MMKKNKVCVLMPVVIGICAALYFVKPDCTKATNEDCESEIQQLRAYIHQLETEIAQCRSATPYESPTPSSSPQSQKAEIDFHEVRVMAEKLIKDYIVGEFGIHDRTIKFERSQYAEDMITPQGNNLFLYTNSFEYRNTSNALMKNTVFILIEKKNEEGLWRIVSINFQ